MTHLTLGIKITVTLAIVFSAAATVLSFIHLKKDGTETDYIRAAKDCTVSALLARLLSAVLIVLLCLTADNGAGFGAIPAVYRPLGFVGVGVFAASALASFLAAVSSNRHKYVSAHGILFLMMVLSAASAVNSFALVYVFS